MHVNLKFHKDFTSCLLSVESKEHDRLVPLELLGGGDPITSGFVGQPFVIKVPHHNNILLSSLGGILGGGHGVAIKGDNGLAVTSVRCVLLKFFPLLNLSSMLLTVVLVAMVQLPPSSEMVITGVEARA